MSSRESKVKLKRLPCGGQAFRRVQREQKPPFVRTPGDNGPAAAGGGGGGEVRCGCGGGRQAGAT